MVNPRWKTWSLFWSIAWGCTSWRQIVLGYWEFVLRESQMNWKLSYRVSHMEHHTLVSTNSKISTIMGNRTATDNSSSTTSRFQIRIPSLYNLLTKLKITYAWRKSSSTQMRSLRKPQLKLPALLLLQTSMNRLYLFINLLIWLKLLILYWLSAVFPCRNW